MIIFLYGPDSFHGHIKLNELKDTFIKQVDNSSNSIISVDGDIAKIEEITEKINTGSLFIKKRLVIIKNIFRNKDNTVFDTLVAYLKKYSKDQEINIIFSDQELNTKNYPLKVRQKKLFNFLKTQKFVQEFKNLNNNQILSFIKQTAKKYNKEIKLPAATLLLNINNDDLWHLDRELKKLSFHNKEKEINIEDIKNFASGFINEDIFSLTDALSARNKTLSIKIFEEQLSAGLSVEYILSMLIRQFKILWQIKQSLKIHNNASVIAKDLKLHPFIVQKGIQQNKKFSLQELKNYYNKLLKLDFLNKQGKSSLHTDLTLFIATI